MAYTGYGGQGYAGQGGVTRSQMDPGYVAGSTTPLYSSETGGMDPRLGMGALNNIYSSWYNTNYLPNQMYNQAQTDLLQNQMDLGGMQSGLATNVANQNFGFQMRNIGLSREGLDVQQGQLARQMGLLPQEYGLQQQGFGLAEQAQQQAAAEQRRSQKSQETISDISGGPGAAQQRADITAHLQGQLAGIGLQRQQAALSFQEKQAQQKDAGTMLGIQSKRLGLSEDETRSRLQNSLDQIGISNAVSVDQILSEMYKVAQGGMSVFEPLFGALAQAQGITIPSGG